MKRRPMVIVAILLTVLVTLQGCGGSGSKTAATTVDDLARQLSGSGDNVAPLEDAIRAGNGGRGTVDDQVAAQLSSRSAVIADIWQAIEDVSGPACDAWTSGVNEVVIDELNEAAHRLQAQALLDQIRTDIDAGRVVSDSVTIACELAGIEF